MYSMNVYMSTWDYKNQRWVRRDVLISSETISDEKAEDLENTLCCNNIEAWKVWREVMKNKVNEYLLTEYVLGETDDEYVIDIARNDSDDDFSWVDGNTYTMWVESWLMQPMLDWISKTNE